MFKTKINKTNKSAFTLIELLVVIAVIGILATLATVALQNARKNARDAKRIADVRQIQTALELYFNDAGEYPSEVTSTITYGSNTYMATYPNSPNTSDGDCSEEENIYSYRAVGLDNNSYIISFCLGGAISNLNAGPKIATPYKIGDWACGDPLIDSRDENTYETVEIGTQCWMAENLAYLPEVHNNADFTTQGVNPRPAYGVYDYDGSDVSTAKALSNYSTYGVSYNWLAIDQVTICPEGWHVSSNAEWVVLYNYLSADNKYLCDNEPECIGKSVASTFGWDDSGEPSQPWHYCYIKYVQSSNNSSGFTALPGGLRDGWDGNFYYNIYNAYFWTSSEYDSYSAYNYWLSGNNRWIYDDSTYSKETGMSVRCIKD